MSNKTKYLLTVAIVMIATVFSSCDSKENEKSIIPINGYDSNVTSNNDNSQNLQLNNDEVEANIESETNSIIYVYVCGAVNYPDVYELPADSRVNDAIKKAGGFTDDAGKEYLNLATTLKDGERIYVPTIEELELIFEGSSEINFDEQAKTSDNGENKNGLVNINTANVDLLTTLPGVGKAKAEKIIAYRENNGCFSTIEDIMLVTGIKEGMFNKIKDYICVN